MDVPDLDVPIHTITIDPAEMAKCTVPEVYSYLSDFAGLERRGYISRTGQPTIISACVDLDKYHSLDHFITNCRKIHKGNAVRDALKANRLGYYSKFFNHGSYTPDIVEINKSTAMRGGVPMTHYHRSVEDYGGYPTRIAPESLPSQTAVWLRRFGVFRPAPGYRQGDVTSDEQLVSYISLRRRGNYAMYSVIIGHADHLPNGVMYKMHFDMVDRIIAARDPTAAEADPSLRSLRGIRYLMYTGYYGIRAGLQVWKKRMLFEPMYTKFDYLGACSVGQLAAATEQHTSNMVWQAQCARMLSTTVERLRREGGEADAAVAQAAFARVVERLTAHAKETFGSGDGVADYYPDRVVVIGPTPRWSEVSPQGSLPFEATAPTLTYPPNSATTGPSPLLRCDVTGEDEGTSVDILISVSGQAGNTNFRLSLGWRREADLGQLGIALPPGEAQVWAVHRSSPDGPWTTRRRVDLRIDPAAPNATDVV